LPENGFIVFLGADLPKKSVVRLKFLEQLRANYSTKQSILGVFGGNKKSKLFDE
jgi:hypothetical protein